MITVVTLEEAAEDIEAGRIFYESRQQDLGNHFVGSILIDIASLQTLAGVHRHYFGFQRMLAKRFPFGIYYEKEQDTAFVYAVLDLRRDPLWIHEQLMKR